MKLILRRERHIVYFNPQRFSAGSFHVTMISLGCSSSSSSRSSCVSRMKSARRHLTVLDIKSLLNVNEQLADSLPAGPFSRLCGFFAPAFFGSLRVLPSGFQKNGRLRFRKRPQATLSCTDSINRVSVLHRIATPKRLKTHRRFPALFCHLLQTRAPLTPSESAPRPPVRDPRSRFRESETSEPSPSPSSEMHPRSEYIEAP